jgi:uncharacterized protein (AIM24 family)
VFQTVYEVDPSAADGAKGEVCFASCVPGDAVHIPMQPGETLVLSRGAYLASSPNVKVSGKLNWRGLLPVGQEEGLVLPKVTCEDDGPGCVFVSAYGGFREHNLGEGETLLVDNGLFLMCDGHTAYTLVKLGQTLMSSFLGGEGFGMQFKGPCRVYTQSRNFNDLVAQIAYRLPGESGGGGAAGSLLGAVVDGGGNGKPITTQKPGVKPRARARVVSRTKNKKN